MKKIIIIFVLLAIIFIGIFLVFQYRESNKNNKIGLYLDDIEINDNAILKNWQKYNNTNVNESKKETETEKKILESNIEKYIVKKDQIKNNKEIFIVKEKGAIIFLPTNKELEKHQELIESGDGPYYTRLLIEKSEKQKVNIIQTNKRYIKFIKSDKTEIILDKTKFDYLWGCLFFNLEKIKYYHVYYDNNAAIEDVKLIK
ncbi:hypothetical protein ACFL56_00975 [Candidatus Margulisiibacteriota bacterium]